MDWLTGFILVGGKSSRMGTDKARLQLGDRSFTERIAAALSTVTTSVGVVGGSAHNHPGLKSTPDVFTAWGALGGIHAALANCHTEWTMVVACDLPFVTPDLLKRLIRTCVQGSRPWLRCNQMAICSPYAPFIASNHAWVGPSN